MNFGPADFSAAAKHGIGLNDPRLGGFLQANKRERIAKDDEMRTRSILYGARLVKTYPTARAWLAGNPGTHAPIWLGHDPETTIHERGNQTFVKFAASGIHRASIFEICGRNFRRLH